MYIPDKFKGKLQIDYQPQKSELGSYDLNIAMMITQKYLQKHHHL